MSLVKSQLHYFSRDEQPVLEFKDPAGHLETLPFERQGAGREAGEIRWLAEPCLPAGEWSFRIKLGHGEYDAPAGHSYYRTALRRLWLQDGQIFDYEPASQVYHSQVIKIPAFKGSLPSRALYIYLPRGYSEHTRRRYPVLYMHDGQNCFEAFSHDSFSGSWQADTVADWLISQGRMRECIIVGVSNGGSQRNLEYLPPYTILPARLMESPAKGGKRAKRSSEAGRADDTLAYYRDEVDPYIRRYYRVLPGREHTATCGSSMGGLFSTYIAWECPEFARHHAILSPSYWITRTAGRTLEAVERLRRETPRDVRLWLDSGTLDSPGFGTDGMEETQAARDALLENGYVEGPDFRYHLAEGAIHHESAWAARLHLIFEFLFPLPADEGRS